MIRSRSLPEARALQNATLAWPLAWLAVVALTVPGPLHAQEAGEGDNLRSAGEIVAEMFEREQRRSEEVHGYAKLYAGIIQDQYWGNRSDQPQGAEGYSYQEKLYCNLPSGETRVVWRTVEAAEFSARLKEGDKSLGTSENLRNAANMMGEIGVLFNAGAEGEGVPIGLLTLIGSPSEFGGVVQDDSEGGTRRSRGDRPEQAYYVNVLNPGSIIAGYGLFLNALADGVDMVNSLRWTAAAFCKAALGQRVAMADDLKTVSRKQVGNREAWQLEAMLNETFQIAGGSEPNLEDMFALLPDASDMSWSSRPTANPANLVAGPRSSATEADIELTVRKFTLQVDTEYYVPLLIRIEGIVTEDGEPKPYPVIIEKENKLHQQVPGTEMLLPYVEVMRIWGFTDLGPEMEEARREMAKLKAQLAQLPPEDRAMVEKTMGSKIRTMELMAEGAPMVHETRVEEIILNLDLPHNPSSATNPIVLECMPGDEDCVETDADAPQAEAADSGT